MSNHKNQTPEQIAAIRKWAENWKRVGPLLEKIRHEELRALTDEQSAIMANDLFEFALSAPNYQLRPSSGLVEQQRLFLKSKKS
ncbi:MAG TPA: hypothetical protein VGJ15_03040 [Pirellulales bacterium]|jgi:hypothetical protein